MSCAARDSALAASIESYQQRIERVLDHELFRDDTATTRLRQAMRYSVLGGGKRLRPVLVYLTGTAFAARFVSRCLSCWRFTSTMASAGRSFTLPPGFFDSSLPTTVAPPSGDMRARRPG